MRRELLDVTLVVAQEKTQHIFVVPLCEAVGVGHDTLQSDLREPLTARAQALGRVWQASRNVVRRKT